MTGEELARTRQITWPEQPRQRKRRRARGPVGRGITPAGSDRAKVFGPEDGIKKDASVHLRWIISTMVAGIVGATGIGAVILGSSDIKKAETLADTFERTIEDAIPKDDGLQDAQTASFFTRAKSDKLPTSDTGAVTQHVIHESIVTEKRSRRFIRVKPYERIVARLSTSSENMAQIPPFNPFRLYANLSPIRNARQADAASRDDVEIASLDLDTVPATNFMGKELPDAVVMNAVIEAIQIDQNDASRLDDEVSSETTLASPLLVKTGPEIVDGYEVARASDPVGANTTVLAKSVVPSNGTDEFAGQEIRVVTVRKGDSLLGILRRAGAQSWQALAIVEAASPVFSSRQMKPGQQVRLTMVPSPTQDNLMEPRRVSVFGAGQQHLVSVVANNAGEYEASVQPIDTMSLVLRPPSADSIRPSIYSSVYQVGRIRELPDDLIMRILKVHAYDTDFKRRVAPGDEVELFFDRGERDSGSEGDTPGALLFTSIKIGNTRRDFYRYRTPDGVIDFYDADGNSAKKFLMRKPVRGGGVRFTSSFGFRMHPILRRRKMHTGVDWAAARGTPILAAGNGVIEEAGRKGGYGNYVRIRHANGYKTSYAHMRRIGRGVRVGAKVRQGQVIGQVGSTGLSSGPHLHYEVLVNNRPVNPMSISVPRGRQLKGKAKLAFTKERRRIDELRRRIPVSTQLAEVKL